MRIKRQIGLYFGSFNPIHIGHLAIANIVQQKTNLDEVWFVVSPQNPLKEADGLLPFEHRVAMVELALKDSDVLVVKDDESLLPVPSYSVQTIKYMEAKYSNRSFSLIMGSDNLDVIHLWKDFNLLLDNYRIFIYDRPGGLGESCFVNKVEIVNAPQMELSGSYIRNMVKDGYDVTYLVPAGVYDYIKAHKLLQ